MRSGGRDSIFYVWQLLSQDMVLIDVVSSKRKVTILGKQRDFGRCCSIT